MDAAEINRRLGELSGNSIQEVTSWSKTIDGKEYDFQITLRKKSKGTWVKHFSYENFCNAKDGSFKKSISTQSLQSKLEVEQLFIPYI